VLLAIATAPAPAVAATPCPPDQPAPITLPHLRRALAAGEQLVIVTIGSSSTESWRASDGAHSYPAVLQDALAAALPTEHVAVLNRGVNGEDAPEEIARLGADALAVRPQLVIWQVGANGALHGLDPTLFARLVGAGIRRVRAAEADLVLMDNQRAPRLLAARDDKPIEQTLARVAAATGTPLFSRDALMARWERLGYPPGLFLASDRLHHNDLGYRCIAEALAARITAGLALSAGMPLQAATLRPSPALAPQALAPRPRSIGPPPAAGQSPSGMPARRNPAA